MSVASVGYAPISPSPLPVEFRPQAIRQTVAQSEPKAKPQVVQNTADAVNSASADIQRLSSALNKKLLFEVDHRSNEVIVKVIDKETDKVIREIPPEELQRLHRSLKEVIGLLLDEMA